jgi:hypothetical protein
MREPHRSSFGRTAANRIAHPAYGWWPTWLILVASFLGVAALLSVLGSARESAQKTPSADSSAQNARSADSFVDSIGVNTHVSYFDTAYEDYPLIRDSLADLGVRHIRDGVRLTDDPQHNRRIDERYQGLIESGLKLNLILGPVPSRFRTVSREEVAAIAEMAGPGLEMLEGPNEYDATDLKGENPDWAEELRSYQRNLYQIVKGYSTTADVPVLGPSLIGYENYNELGYLGDYLDYGNIHSYSGGRRPETSGWGANNYGSIEYNMDLASRMSGSEPQIVTEAGYHNAWRASGGHPGISEEAAASYIPRMYLEYFNQGIVRTYAYELIDELPNPRRDDPELHFGLLRYDGSEKPSYTALKNLISLLEDPGSLLEDPGEEFEPQSLRYTLGGDTSDVHSTLLQKRDGRFYLILWLQKPVYDLENDENMAVPAQRVNIELEAPAEKVNTYLPNESVSPVEQHARTERLALDVPVNPLVVEIYPVKGQAPVTPPGPLFLGSGTEPDLWRAARRAENSQKRRMLDA